MTESTSCRGDVAVSGQIERLDERIEQLTADLPAARAPAQLVW